MGLEDFLENGEIRFLLQDSIVKKKEYPIYVSYKKTTSDDSYLVSRIIENFSLLKIDFGKLQLSDFLESIVALGSIPWWFLLKKLVWNSDHYNPKFLKKSDIIALPVFYVFYLLWYKETYLVSMTPAEFDDKPALYDVIYAIWNTPGMAPLEGLAQAYALFQTLSIENIKALSMRFNSSHDERKNAFNEVPANTTALQDHKGNSNPVLDAQVSAKVLRALHDLFIKKVEKKFPLLIPSIQNSTESMLEGTDRWLESNPHLKDIYYALSSIPLHGILIFMKPVENKTVPFSSHHITIPEHESLKNALVEIGLNGETKLIGHLSDEEKEKSLADFKEYQEGKMDKDTYIKKMWVNAFKQLRNMSLTDDEVLISCKLVMAHHSKVHKNFNLYNLLQPICLQMVSHRTLTFKKLDTIVTDASTREIDCKDVKWSKYSFCGPEPAIHDTIESEKNIQQFVKRLIDTGYTKDEVQKYIYNGQPENTTILNVKEFQSSITTYLNGKTANNDGVLSSFFSWFTKLEQDKKKEAFKTNRALNIAFEKYSSNYSHSNAGKELTIKDFDFQNEENLGKFNEYLEKEYGPENTILSKVIEIFFSGNKDSKKGVERLYRFNTMENQIIMLGEFFSSFDEALKTFQKNIPDHIITSLNRICKTDGLVITDVFHPAKYQSTLQKSLKVANLLALSQIADPIVTAIGAIHEVTNFFKEAKEGDIFTVSGSENEENDLGLTGIWTTVLNDKTVHMVTATFILDSETFNNYKIKIQDNILSLFNTAGSYFSDYSNILGIGGGIGGLSLGAWRIKSPSGSTATQNIQPTTGSNALPKSMIKMMMRLPWFFCIELLLGTLVSSIISGSNAPSFFNLEAYAFNQVYPPMYKYFQEENIGANAFPFFRTLVFLITYFKTRKVSLLLWSRILGAGTEMLPRRGLSDISNMQDITYSLFYVVWHRSVELREKFYDYSQTTDIDLISFISILNFNLMNMCPIECRDNPYHKNEWQNIIGEWTNSFATSVFAAYQPLSINFFTTLALHITERFLNGFVGNTVPSYRPNHSLLPKKYPVDMINYKTLLENTKLPYHKIISKVPLQKEDKPFKDTLKNLLSKQGSIPYVAVFLDKTLDSINESFDISTKFDINFELCAIVFEETSSVMLCKLDDKWYKTEKSDVSLCLSPQIQLNSIRYPVKVLMFQLLQKKPKKTMSFEDKFSEKMNMFNGSYKVIDWEFKPHTKKHTSCLFEALCALYFHSCVEILDQKENQNYCNKLVQECKRLFIIMNKDMTIPKEIMQLNDELTVYREDIDILIALSSRHEIVKIFKIAFMEYTNTTLSSEFPEPVFYEKNPEQNTMIYNPAVLRDPSFVIGVIPQIFDSTPISVFVHYVPLESTRKKDKTSPKKKFKLDRASIISNDDINEKFVYFGDLNKSNKKVDNYYDDVFFHG